MVSRAYSHPAIRLKKFPIIGLIAVALFQGAHTFYMSIIGINGVSFESLLDEKILYGGSLCTLMLFGSYPMTQVYQHGEDGKRGDLTMSRMLGIEGTFLWTGGIFFLVSVGFFFYFLNFYSLNIALTFPLFLLPTLIYFSYWYLNVRGDKSKADFKSTMRLNTISSICFICFFLYLYMIK
jgi:1,4-dihydroxy-2-naphthoate octaprenyltransferase